MQFKQGAPVFSEMGDRVGEVNRIVMDPRTKEVTHVVISTGVIFKNDKVVPISLIGTATEAGLRLRPDAEDLELLPEFEAEHYVPASGTDSSQESNAPTLYWYPPAGPLQTGGYQPVVPDTKIVERNVPANSVALQKGARVITEDDREVGQVVEVLTDIGTDQVTFLVLEKGLLNKEHKLIPSHWLTQITDEEVHLAVSARQIDELREYVTNTPAP